MARIRLRSVVLDCPDPVALAGFYGQLLDGRVVTTDPAWSEVHLDEVGIKLAFQRVDAYRPPQWPAGTPQQLHWDLTVDELVQSSARAVELGASVLGEPVQEDNCTFVVHADPAGHPFCLCVSDD
ncbi:MAG: VOC family protein [Acidimicrobiales bacterium]